MSKEKMELCGGHDTVKLFPKSQLKEFTILLRFGNEMGEKTIWLCPSCIKKYKKMGLI